MDRFSKIFQSYDEYFLNTRFNSRNAQNSMGEESGGFKGMPSNKPYFISVCDFFL